MVQLPSERHRPRRLGGAGRDGGADGDGGVDRDGGPDRDGRVVPGRVTGRVRWFNEAQGVGIVEIPSRGYAHLYYKDILGDGYRALDPGDRVSFWIEESERGPIVREIRREASLPRE
jgi:CspA family cold shock protein